MGRVSPISVKFTKLCKDLHLHQKGRGFYSLRHVFATFGDGTGDRDAVEAILVHAPTSQDMLSHYREKMDDRHLVHVVRYVRRWLGLAKYKIAPLDNEIQTILNPPAGIILPASSTAETGVLTT